MGPHNEESEMTKLTQKQMDEMWGDGGPYSQVQLITEERLLDDSVSRVFIIVSANVNPFTFKYVKKHREKFKKNEIIQWVLNNSEYAGIKYGYCCYTFQSEYFEEKVMKEAKQALEKTRNLVLQMHRFVIEEFGLKTSKKTTGKVIAILGWPSIAFPH